VVPTRRGEVALARARELLTRTLETVPQARRMLEELVRVGVVDRAMVVAAQALLALVPLVVVLAAFLPAHLTGASVDRFDDVTGLSRATGDMVTGQVEPLQSNDQIRAQTGYVGLVVVVLSASSFARALMRTYERIWDLPSVPGLRGRRRALGWLLGWLVALQLLTLTGWARARMDAAVDDVPARAVLGSVGLAIQVVVATLLWWWTLHVLLSGRVRWAALAPAALVTGMAIVLYSAGSALVMPRYAATSAAQYGTFGLVLAVATWLVGCAGVLVVAAVVGRALAEEPVVQRLTAHLTTRVAGRAGRLTDAR
jgi:membrane protein